MTLRTADFDYTLPTELIAQEPAQRRDASRLLVLDRASGAITHDTFAGIGRYLRPGDALVANRSRVIPARLSARKETGGLVELLLLRKYDSEDGNSTGVERWKVLARPSRKLKKGMELDVEESELIAVLESSSGDGEWCVRFRGFGDIARQLRGAGSVPLPPYIHESATPAERYQTVYADRDGSVAAPTAGLHFSESLLKELDERGVNLQFVTLHIGLGTFRPVTVENVKEHRMHAEWGEVPEGVARALNEVRAEGGRVVAVGTTAARLLETAWDGERLRPFIGDTDRFIYPGYEFGAVDALVTNFHLPRSTLLMLVSAFAGRKLVLRAYAEAVRERYRFYSFGDAMLIV